MIQQRKCSAIFCWRLSVTATELFGDSYCNRHQPRLCWRVCVQSEIANFLLDLIGRRNGMISTLIVIARAKEFRDDPVVQRWNAIDNGLIALEQKLGIEPCSLLLPRTRGLINR